MLGERDGLLLVVGHHDGGGPNRPQQRLQLQTQLLAELRVEVRQRLVQEQDVRLDRQSAGQRHPLLLAATELTGSPPLEADESDLLEPPPHPVGDLTPSDPALAHAVRDVLLHRHMREQGVVLEHQADAPLVRTPACHVPARDPDRAPVRCLEAGNEAQGGRLAAATRTQQRDALPGSNREGQGIDGRDTPEALDDVLQLDGAHRVPEPLTSGRCRRR